MNKKSKKFILLPLLTLGILLMAVGVINFLLPNSRIGSSWLKKMLSSSGKSSNLFQLSGKTAMSALQISSEGIAGSIFLDNTYLDKTPYVNNEIKAGIYHLKIEPEDERYKNFEANINLTENASSFVKWYPGKTKEESGAVIMHFTKIANNDQACLNFTTQPDDGIIQILHQGKKIGQPHIAPYLIKNLEHNEYEFTVKLPSYKTYQRSITPKKGYCLNIDIHMAKDDGFSDRMKNDLPTDSNLSNTQSLDTNSIETTTLENQNTTTIDTQSTDSPENSQTPQSSKHTQNSNSDQSTNNEDNNDNDPPTYIMEAENYVLINKTRYYHDGDEVLKVRNSIGLGGKIIGYAEVGQVYAYLEESDLGWHKIMFNNEEGWVSGAFCEIISADEANEELGIVEE